MPDPISPYLDGLTPAERADFKAEALASIFTAAGRPGPNQDPSLLSWITPEGVTIIIQSVTYDSGLLAVVLEASDADGALPMPDFEAGERYLFRNPPIRRWVQEPVMDEDGTVLDIGETEENIATVSQGWITDAVYAYARNHGWEG